MRTHHRLGGGGRMSNPISLQCPSCISRSETIYTFIIISSSKESNYIGNHLSYIYNSYLYTLRNYTKTVKKIYTAHCSRVLWQTCWEELAPTAVYTSQNISVVWCKKSQCHVLGMRPGIKKKQNKIATIYEMYTQF